MVARRSLGHSCLSHLTWKERAHLGGKKSHNTHTLQLAGLIQSFAAAPTLFFFFSLCLSPLGHTKVDEREKHIDSHTFLNDLIHSFIHANLPLILLCLVIRPNLLSLNSSCCFRAKTKKYLTSGLHQRPLIYTNVENISLSPSADTDVPSKCQYLLPLFYVLHHPFFNKKNKLFLKYLYVEWHTVQH